MLDLCIDTSSGISVAIVKDGTVLARGREADERRHAEDLAALIEAATQQAGLSVPVAGAGWSRVLVGTGPAPYTGLRAGLISAEVFARAANVPLYGVPSLAIIARGALDVLPAETEVIAVTDARRKEVYWARYRSRGPNDVEPLSELQVTSPQALTAELRRSPAVLVGPGAPLIWEEARADTGPTDPPFAAVISRLVDGALSRGETLPADPLYLRRPDIN